MINRFRSWIGPVQGPYFRDERGMMSIRRVLALAVALAVFGAASPAIEAQQNNQQRKDQEKRSEQEQQDIQQMVRLVDAVMMGQQPAPTDIGITWDSNHFVKGVDGATYIPFNLTIDRSKLADPAVAMYVRVVSKTPAPAPAAEANGKKDGKNDKEQPRVVYPWDNVHFFAMPANGKVSRAMAVKPGEYEVFIAVKEATKGKPAKNAPPAKISVFRRDLSVPDFTKPELATSSVIIASDIQPVTTPLTAQQQSESPYTFGTMTVVPSVDAKLKKSSELQVLFWVYGAEPDAASKPDVTIEYSFYQKTADGEKYFNKTAPQALNATTLPAEFNAAAGHQLPGSLVVPLGSFPAGDYRLEIKITDKKTSKTLTQNATFTVES
jgi:hypothetical protein